MSAPRRYWIMLALASCTVVSLGMNSISMRDRQRSERTILTTQQSVLRELNIRYRRGERVPENEEARLLRLANIRVNKKEEQKTTVMQAIFGRQPTPADEAKELEKLKQFWEEALREDESQKSTLP
ncbi:hypothetical protein DACRYDRAFT_97373 [Dacryopinax primogenitus]|uniref:Uncharacterized protein n=1 Tax=Dacryopinax primogenitus (strain DJM 731) TaxID=1858805 RepID=M5FZK4_DACPD|nr:uncharacterized protein DACRYDRAFT_97373 [Dacryopinax primogenitus]EJT96932.1 hypothetical protein DACRYDRAFT_97373 [Dacryopinax primogenitus]